MQQRAGPRSFLDRRGKRGVAAAACLLAASLGAASCRPGPGSERGPPAIAGAPPADARRLPVWVEAEPRTRYYAKCHIRTFKDPDGRDASGELQGFANTYVIDTAGPFRDRLPSPNAQCLLTKISGKGDVVIHIFKAGDHSVRTQKPMTWVRLNVW